jgi:hypothetical protein
MDRSNHYEAAFEDYLRGHRLSYIGVDETRRSFLGAQPVKSLDFIVHDPQGGKWLIDVKGRRYPGGTPEHPRHTWECWSTREDVDSLQQWATCFGPGYRPLLVFMYHLQPFGTSLPDDEDLWTWQGRRYLLRAVPIETYRQFMHIRSPKWATVMLTANDFRRLSHPFSTLVRALPVLLETRE